ncbi:hypothetical protein ACJJTC_000439 [Scirpophaga incertulas]
MELKLILYCVIFFCLTNVGSIPWDVDNLPRYPEAFNNEPIQQQNPPRGQYRNWDQQVDNNDRFYHNWQYPGINQLNQNDSPPQNWPEHRYTPNVFTQPERLYSGYPPIVPENQNSATNTPFVTNGWQNINQGSVQNQPIQNGFPTFTEEQYFNQQQQPNQQATSYENFNDKPQEVIEHNQKTNNNVNYDQFYPPIPSVPNKPPDATNNNAIIIDEASSVQAQPVLKAKSELREAPPVSDSDDRYLASASNPIETVSRPVFPQETIEHQIKKIISDPRIRGILSSGKRKRYMIVHPNGTIEHVNTLQAITQEQPNYVLVHASNLVSNPEVGKQTNDGTYEQQTSSVNVPIAQEASASIDLDIKPVPSGNLQTIPENVEIIPDKQNTEITVEEQKINSRTNKTLPIVSTNAYGPQNSTNKNSPLIEIPPEGKVLVSVNSSLPASSITSSKGQVPSLLPNFNNTVPDNNTISKADVLTEEKELDNIPSRSNSSLASAEAVSGVAIPVEPIANATASTYPSSIPNVGDLDISKVKATGSPLVWFNSSEKDFLKKLAGNDKGFDVVYFFQVQSPPKIDNEITRTVFPNGTIIEESVTTVWSPEQDKPTVTKTTKIIQPEDKPVT